ncbi:MAG: ADP-ribosylglycohydrolase family protein [Gemmatimonadetes bacterium]|nr:ADP-ribosylglycohydrolase family protein [Gemmatimonadota bacterium]
MAQALLMTRPTLDQVTGSLLGLAVGDAVGAVVEAHPPDDARRYAETILRPGRLPERGREAFPFGQVTDDTQLARELLLSVGVDGTFDPARFATRLLNLVASGRFVGGGPAAHAAARQLALGVPWHDAGAPRTVCRERGGHARRAARPPVWARPPPAGPGGRRPGPHHPPGSPGRRGRARRRHGGGARLPA